MAAKLKKGDKVVVLAGKDKGKQGEIAFVFPKSNKIIVHGVNTASKHQKARRANEAGGIIEKDLPFDVSNVMLVHKGKEFEEAGEVPAVQQYLDILVPFGSL